MNFPPRILKLILKVFQSVCTLSSASLISGVFSGAFFRVSRASLNSFTALSHSAQYSSVSSPQALKTGSSPD